MKWYDIIPVIAVCMGLLAYWLGTRLNRRERRNVTEAQKAAEDSMIYGSGFLRMDADGTVRRIRPQDVYFKSSEGGVSNG